MTARVLIAVTLLASVVLILPAAPAAACTAGSQGSTQVTSGVTGLLINGEQAAAAAACSSTTTKSAGGPPVLPPPRDSGLDAICVREAIEASIDPFVFCDLPREPSAAPAVTPGLVAAAFRELVLPAAELVVQPPGGRTLVNFETNFFTEQGELSRTVSVLGREVELRIRPESYDWRFGDGGSRVTTGPGSAYPDLEVTHRYLRAGRVAPSVAVTYAARFRVGDGAWRPVTGTVTVPGKPQPLRVVEARPVLVGH